MSELRAESEPETLQHALSRYGVVPSWRINCRIEKGEHGLRVISPDGLWTWSSQLQSWRSVTDSVLGYYGSFEFAARALAACPTPPPGSAEAERTAYAAGQRAWLINRGSSLNAIALGLEDFATDERGIRSALAKQDQAHELEASPIHALVSHAGRIVDACGKILSAARAAFGGLGAAIEGRSVEASSLVEDIGDIHGVGISVVDCTVSHGGTEGTPNGRTDAPAAPVAELPAQPKSPTDWQLAQQLYAVASDVRGVLHQQRIRDVANVLLNRSGGEA